MTREEAIRILASSCIPGSKQTEALETLIPELKESEDERIRKELKEAFEAYDIESTWNGIPIRSIFAWLEKQKEQKPELPKPHKGDDNNPYDMRVSEAQEYAIKRGFSIPFNDGEVYVDERHITQTIGNILRWADEHPKEQKPAEWIEEDKRILKGIIGLVDHNQHYNVSNKEMLDWLKSLKPSWKPSEEHLSALLAIFNDPNNIDSQTCQLALTDLYEHLKKL